MLMQTRKFAPGQTIGGVTIGAARDKLRHQVVAALTDWRLTAIPSRYHPIVEGSQREIIRSGVAEILAIRLEAAYAPILITLERIERRIGVLADIRREPWAPASHPVNRRPVQQGPSPPPAHAPFAYVFDGPI